MNRIVLIGAFCLILNPLRAQDIRYSQFFNNPLTTNPALTGSGINHLRATISYRRQDAGPGNPFATKGASVDKIIGKWGLGFNIHSNGAGDASVKALNLAGSLSYRLYFGYKSSNEVSSGIQIGLLSRSINPSKFTFDNQFNEDIGYDPSIATGESFESNSVIRPSMSTGIQWKHVGRKKSAKFRPYLGYAAFHLNQPNVSFFGDELRYNMKHAISGGADIRFTEELVIKPSFIHTQQGPFNETTIGVLGNYQQGDENQIQAGVFSKPGRAFMFYAGYQMDRFLVGMSYDVASGPIHEAGKGYNAFELSLTFTPKAKPKQEKQDEVTSTKKEEEKKKSVEQKQKTEKETTSKKEPLKSTNSNTVYTADSSKTPPVQKTESSNLQSKPVEAVVEKDVAPVVSSLPIKEEKGASVEASKPVVVAKEEKPLSQEPVVAAKEERPLSQEPAETANTNNITDTQVTIEQKAAQNNIVEHKPEPVSMPAHEKEPVAPKEVVVSSEPIKTVTEVTHSKEIIQENTSSPIENAATAETKETKPESAILKGEPAVSVFTPIVPNNKIVATDSDLDGVNDYEDPCPYIKGTIATRGCPDTDEDGLVDMVDFCPLESGPKTNGGCPVLTARKSTDQQIVSGFDHVLFNTGSITLTIDNTYDIIERAVDFLYFDKSTYVLISGHTDAEGDAASNMVLSQKRADKVKSYFVGQGISESRIKTIPYGENMPISGNGSEAAKKLNRRVEITILKKGE
jgi:type IX secretion system PorP/SprF family membrane protein